MPDTARGEVAERAQQALAESPIYALRELRVDQAENTLTLSGRVATYYQKQLAQEVVRSVADGVTLFNRIDVT